MIAVVFDFDDTLLPDSTSALLEAHGIPAQKFWTEDAANLVRRGYDPPHAYLRLLLERVGPGRPLGALTSADLEAFGATLDSTWFRGLPQLFDDLRSDAAKLGVPVEFYIISGGLQEIVEGSEIVKRYFNGVYACQLEEDLELGYLRHIKRTVTFTEKTRYLFEINKGIRRDDSRTSPHLVNMEVARETRRVPMNQMIYVGDGMTDVPCFSLVRANGGWAFGVFQPEREASAKQAFQQLLAPQRVHSLHHPKYEADDELGGHLRLAVATLASTIDMRTRQALS